MESETHLAAINVLLSYKIVKMPPKCGYYNTVVGFAFKGEQTSQQHCSLLFGGSDSSSVYFTALL